MVPRTLKDLPDHSQWSLPPKIYPLFDQIDQLLFSPLESLGCGWIVLDQGDVQVFSLMSHTLVLSA